MKKGDSLQLSSAWWKANKPGALPKTGLGLALTEYEKYKMTGMSTKPKEAEGRKALKALLALKKVDAARVKAISYCSGPLFYDTKAALLKVGALTTAATLYINGMKPHVKQYEDSVKALATYLTRLDNKLQEYEAAAPGKDKNDAAKEIRLTRERITEYIENCKDGAAMLANAKAAFTFSMPVWNRIADATADWNGMKERSRDAVNDTAKFLEY